MAIMKVKNSAGEWVGAGSADLISEMKTVVVPYTSDKLSYDLSPYIKGNENFLLFFVCEYGSTTGNNKITVLVHMDDLLYVGQLTQSAYWDVTDISTIVNTLTYNTTDRITTWEDIFTWDEETRVLTFVRPMYNYSSMGTKALLLYTGLKEA